MKRFIQAVLLCFACASFGLGAQTVTVTATGGAGCNVYLDGKPLLAADGQPRHFSQRHTAQAEATNQAFANPGAAVELRCDDVLRVSASGAQRAPVPVTATGGAGCNVYVDGQALKNADGSARNFAQRHTAQAEATNQRFANPAAAVEFRCDDVFRVGGVAAPPAPAPDPTPAPNPTPTPIPPPSSSGLSTPGTPVLTTDPGGVKATWAAVSGAADYLTWWLPDGGTATYVVTKQTTLVVPLKTKGEFCLKARSGSEQSSYVCASWDPAPAPTPVPGANSASLYWDPVSIADGYKVYVGAASGVYGAPIAVGQVTTYTVTGLQTGTRYYFAVTATKGSDESVRSNEVSKQF